MPIKRVKYNNRGFAQKDTAQKYTVNLQLQAVLSKNQKKKCNKNKKPLEVNKTPSIFEKILHIERSESCCPKQFRATHAPADSGSAEITGRKENNRYIRQAAQITVSIAI